jgi:fructan beta-fructosidase
MSMQRRAIAIHEDYLHIPVCPGLGAHYSLQIYIDGMLLRDCYLPIASGEPYSYFFLNVSSFSGKTLTLILPQSGDLNEDTLDRIINAGIPEPGNPLYPDLYHETLRPQYHFSTRRGWLNDPNGLLFADGIYHMYYQHNPLGTFNGGVNVSWGHAVSRDLIHWNELDDAIKPWRRDWFIASGSALIDEHNDAGYGEGAIIAAFTALGAHNEIPGRRYASGGQFLAASTDGGNRFHLFSTQAAVPAENGEGWRDPRIFRYGDHYVMAVYEVENKRNCVSFYVSDDLHHWKRASRNMDLYECPDVFPLTDPQGFTRWVLYGADGKARIGDFDGYVFTESKDANLLDYGKATYAGQTWSNHPDGKRIHISWVIGMDGRKVEESFSDTPFSQCMSIPCELTLQNMDGICRVLRNPIEEVNNLRSGDPAEIHTRFSGTYDVPVFSSADYEIQLALPKDEMLVLHAGQHTIRYEAGTKTLHFDNGQKSIISSSELKIRMLVDTTTMELFFGEGVAASFTMHPNDRRLTIDGEGEITCRHWNVQSIWPA